MTIAVTEATGRVGPGVVRGLLGRARPLIALARRWRPSPPEGVVAAAIDARVRRVVYASIIDDQPGSRFYYTPVHRTTEALLAASGLRHLIARTLPTADGTAA